MATWVLDLDGVVWLSDQPIAGSAAAVAALRAAGHRVVVVTNNSALTVGDYLAKLDRFGVPTDRADLITSAQVAATLVEPGERALVCGGPGIRDALTERGVEVVDDRHGVTVDAVVVGWTRDFDYAMLTAAMLAVRAGARLIGTNQDPTYPTPTGLLPGGGSLVTAVAYASGVDALFAGKPNQPTVDAISARFGPVAVMVGDQPRTDGVLARRLGARFALVLSGVTKPEDLPVDPAPDETAPDLAALVRAAGVQTPASASG